MSRTAVSLPRFPLVPFDAVPALRDGWSERVTSARCASIGSGRHDCQRVPPRVAADGQVEQGETRLAGANPVSTKQDATMSTVLGRPGAPPQRTRPGSVSQLALQPSPLVLFPSSQDSPWSFVPSPQ